jgi:hypothetical protein
LISQTRVPQRTISEERDLELTAGLGGLFWPLVITALVVAGAFLGPAALQEPVRGGTPVDARLVVGTDYLVFTPVFNVLDTLSLLTLDQHYAVLATLIGAFVLWRLFRSRHPRGFFGRVGVELGVAALSLLGLVAFYGFGIVGPRPMATLVVDDPAALLVDFHSHTDRSHDGRKGFDAERNREWHTSAGFHAAYVSDHRTYDGYAEAAAGNPERAAGGTVLLPGLEIKYAGKYASALGAPWRYRAAMDGNDLVADSLYRVVRGGGPRPTLVLTIPGGLDAVPADGRRQIGYVAVEVSDASPRGLEQSRRDRASILALADSLNLALVAGSNNHGWGRTAAAWTVLTIPGWRSMTPQRLDQAIGDRLHRERRGASRVVERRVPYAGPSPAALALTVPAITWQMFGGIGRAERIAWLLWTWGVAFGLLPIARLLRRRAPSA